MLVRRLLIPYESPLYMAHLKRLCANDRQMRFEAAVSDTFIEDYVESINDSSHAVFGAFDNSLTFRGAAHVCASRQVADLGLSVEDGYRGLGAGSALLDRAILWARHRQVKKFSSQCLTRNGWMMTKVKERGFAVDTDGEVSIATAELSPLNPIEYTAMAVQEQVAWTMWSQGIITRPWILLK